VLSVDRQCPLWFKHHPGLTPVQHWESRHTHELENARRAWQSDLEEQREIANERGRESDREANRRINHLTIGIGVAGLLLAVAQVAVAIILSGTGGVTINYLR
jgi:hypothetical protein